MSVMTAPEPAVASEGYTGVMHILDGTGDTKIQWSKDNTEEVENARATFDRLRSQGYAAYSVKGKKKNEVLSAFDPEVESMILAPAMVGG
jgi:transketolase N-terminal domain/subunit